MRRKMKEGIEWSIQTTARDGRGPRGQTAARLQHDLGAALLEGAWEGREERLKTRRAVSRRTMKTRIADQPSTRHARPSEAAEGELRKLVVSLLNNSLFLLACVRCSRQSSLLFLS